MYLEKNNRKRQIYKLGISEIPCLCCGVCCSKFQPRLDLSEARTIAAHLGVNLERFLTDYTDPRWPGTRSLLLRHVNGACVFLRTSEEDKKKLCFIHSFKPSCCVEWKQGIDRSECLEGLKADWDLSVDYSGKICGPKEKIESFEKFILLNRL